MDTYKILVAEDEKEIRDLIGIYLNNEKYNVIFASDGKEAVKKYKEEKPDLIIMDLMMPVMNGEEAIIKIREDSYVPIIILSAKSEDYDKVIGLNIGADDYITKPFNPLELMARVNATLRRYNNYKDNEKKDDIIIGSVRLNKSEKTIYLQNKKNRLNFSWI